jgi:hypothetical protein
MPTKRDVLEHLKRDELLAAVDRHEIPVRDRRVRAELVEARRRPPRPAHSSPYTPSDGYEYEQSQARLSTGLGS